MAIARFEEYWSEVLKHQKHKPGKSDDDDKDGTVLPKRTKRRMPATTVDKEDLVLHQVSLPTGSFEFSTITDLLAQRLLENDVDFQVTVDPSTLKCIVLSSAKLDSPPQDSIGKLLGFTNTQFIEPNTSTRSDNTVQISRPNVIRITCNIVTGSYSNGITDHVIYEFYPNVDPGYKMVVTVQNVIYLPIDIKQIGSITLQVVDEYGRLINNGGEEINIALHLRQRK